jgi:hypothetical protein
MLELWPRGRSQPRRALSQALRDAARRCAASLRRVQPEASLSTSLVGAAQLSLVILPSGRAASWPRPPRSPAAMAQAPFLPGAGNFDA